MPEWHLRQLRFTYNAGWLFTRHGERVQKFKETGDLNHVYKSKLEKVFFAYDEIYSDSNDLATRTISQLFISCER